MTKPAQPTGPLAPQARLIGIDAARGFAILGVLIANIITFGLPYHQFADAAFFSEGADRMAVQSVRFLVEGKFYALLSLLFGLGFGMVRLRTRQQERPFYGPTFRRLAWLLLAGLLHFLLLSEIDVLASYALLAMVLVPLFAGRRPATVLIAACLFLPLLVAAYLVIWRLADPADPIVAGRSGEAISTAFTQFQEQHHRIYTGDYSHLFSHRLQKMAVSVLGSFFAAILFVLPPFLLGLYLGLKGFFNNPEIHAGPLRRLFRVSLAVGLLFSWVDMSLRASSQVMLFSPNTLIWMVSFFIGCPAMGLAYLSGVVRLAHNSQAFWLKPLAAVGRLSLSNYVLQSLIASLLFHGYGLGLYDRMGPATSLLLVPVIFAINVAFSLAWTRRYKFGPLEGLWRRLSYGS